ncbi:hypothetical protein [Microbacterium stercoris]|uniref:Uncharacterized protein n=1 Tax=Microbacterium stercoris TaxID=2820289 RepID=A0A939QLG7_9MICO|nr:hypothetical protein [Microbacterium stercoris]MBO3663882.1 hypothetical protein [Microbacterium stercoris]
MTTSAHGTRTLAQAAGAVPTGLGVVLGAGDAERAGHDGLVGEVEGERGDIVGARLG